MLRRVTAGLGLCVGLGLHSAALAATVKASSELETNAGERFPASAAFDGSLLTAWAEGDMGVGDGAWIELRFDAPTPVSSVSIWPGDLRKGERSLKENGRPKYVTVTLDTGGEPVTATARVRDGATAGIQRVDVPIEGTAKALRITIDEAYGGYLHNDTYLAEVAVNFVSGDPPAALARLETWKESTAAVRSADAHRDAVVGLFDAIDQAEFGDRDALRQLMDYATDGAPWLADRVRREVPYGFRLQALPGDPVAIEALLKLRDANAIPALRMAALRLHGKEERSLLAKVEYFEAYTDLASGGRRNLDTWGVSGWEKGALRSFGEPENVELGLFGDLYVADVANHRITVFTQAGTVRDLWGDGQAEVTNTWFDGKRAYYVAGKQPSTADRGFTNPLDLELVKGKESEELIVLDALGRVQWLDPNGQLEASWKVRAESGVSPGVGGEAQLMLVKGKVVVVWGNEVIVYDPAGEELARWSVEDGVPMTAEPLRNGKIILGFQKEGVLYSLDGFRHGVVIRDELPAGYEAWDLASDEKGKLWIVTDNGWALKLKKPGVVDFSVRWTERSATVPRLAVYDGMLYVVADDKVHKVDALELKAKADAAAAEGE